MKVSLVTSAYKKEDVITTQLNRIIKTMSNYDVEFELIVVVDGIIDTTVDTVNEFITNNPNQDIKLLARKENRGKGYSLRQGMMIASGDIIGIIDADTDVQMYTLEFAMNNMLAGATAVIPSKYHPLSEYRASIKRQIMSRAFQAFTKFLLPTPKGIDDVSSGLKLFKAEVIRDVLSELTVDGFAIDSELLYLINKHGYKATRTPFHMIPQDNSTADNAKQIVKIVKDVLAVAYRVRINEIKALVRALSLQLNK